MALINCSECHQEVSEKAESCPKCGTPVASARETFAAGTQIKTVQETSKKFKLQTVISVLLIIIGVAWLISISNNPQGESSAMPSLSIFIGLVWSLINRFRIWWHHKQGIKGTLKIGYKKRGLYSLTLALYAASGI